MKKFDDIAGQDAEYFRQTVDDIVLIAKRFYKIHNFRKVYIESNHLYAKATVHIIPVPSGKTIGNYEPSADIAQFNVKIGTKISAFEALSAEAIEFSKALGVQRSSLPTNRAKDIYEGIICGIIFATSFPNLARLTSDVLNG